MEREKAEETAYYPRSASGGETWLMKEFGKCAYEKTVYINFDSNSIGEKRERNR